MFKFKQFTIDDSHSAMKIGTDGVLLGAWADVAGDSHILDAGTGTGLIALMVAQRNCRAKVSAIDIVEESAVEARANADKSPWGERVEVGCADLRSYRPQQQFYHIVSNPPFFVDSIPSPDAVRAMARHTTTLDYADIVSAAEELLCAGGRLSIVLPFECGARFRRVAFERLWLSRQTTVITREGDIPKRLLMEFVKSDKPLMPRCDTLLIQLKDGEYTEEYRALTQDFYLMF